MKRRSFINTAATLVAGGVSANLAGQILRGESLTVNRDMLNNNNAEDSFELNEETVLKKNQSVTVSKSMPITYEAEFNTPGYLPADGMQQWRALAQCESNPDCLAAFQDTGSLWLSYDHGKRWRRPKRSGLDSFQSTGGEIDPLDPNRIFVIASGSFLTNAPGEGLYFSVDGGMNFTRKIKVTNETASGTISGITYAPSSKDTELQKTKRWYCFYTAEKNDAIPIYISDNYGESFSLVRTVSKTAYGSIAYARVHPTDQNLVYTVGGGGLARFSRADLSTGSISIMSGQNGLPTGSINASPYISSDGNTIIVGVASKGNYKTENAGGSWTKIGSETTLRKLWVNNWNPDHMILTYSHDQGFEPRYSTNGGLTFSNPVSMERRPGYSGTIQPTYNYSHVAFHPEQGQAFLAGRITSMPGNSSLYRTADFGANWKLSMVGFSGAQFKSFSSPQMFDPIDKNRLAFPMVDIGVWLTSTGGKWFHPNTMRAGVLGLPEISQFGIALHPDASKKTILALPSSSGNQFLFGSYDDGLTWTRILADTYKSKSAYVCFDPADPSFAFWDRYRSNNHGALESWSVMSGLPSGWGLWGASLNDPAGAGLFAIDIGNYQKFRRSTDKGETWPIELEIPHKTTGPGFVWGLVQAHPTDRNILFTKGNPTHTIWKWNLSSGTPTTRPYTVLNVFGPDGIPPVTGNPVEIYKLAIDPRYPNVMYAATTYAGSSYRLFRTTDGGNTAWENISHLVPTCCNYNALEVSPVTGDVIFSGSNGIFIFPPPYPQEGTLSSELTLENYLQNEPYTDPTHVKNIDRKFKEEIIVFPNPSRGFYTLDLKYMHRDISLAIHDSSGRLVQKAKRINERQVEVYLKEPAGIYFLAVNADNKRAVVQLIKN